MMGMYDSRNTHKKTGLLTGRAGFTVFTGSGGGGGNLLSSTFSGSIPAAASLAKRSFFIFSTFSISSNALANSLSNSTRDFAIVNVLLLRFFPSEESFFFGSNEVNTGGLFEPFNQSAPSCAGMPAKSSG